MRPFSLSTLRSGRRAASVLAIFLGVIGSSSAQDADFRIQGEYAHPGMGVQVIAQGSGAFTAVFLMGGLPGDGWDGKSRVEVSGTAQGGQAVFHGSGYSATIPAAGDSLRYAPTGASQVTLPKVMRKSPTLGAVAPAGAVILFDGTGLSEWNAGTAVLTADKLFQPQGSFATTKRKFQGFTLHLEFREPFLPASSGQQRGNSGVYLQGRQELQVLDSFGKSISHPPKDTCCLPSMEECGAFFDHSEPLVNMCFPPLSWQTYDVSYTAAKYGGSTMTAPARVTVRHNGVAIQNDKALPWPTLLGDQLGADPGPFWIQYHGGEAVSYRNIWVTEGDPVSLKPALRRRPSLLHPSALAGVDGRIVPPARARGYHVGYPSR